MKKKQDNEDMFLSFLIKEKEIAYIEKIHAQTTIKYMAKCFQEKEDNATIIKKTFWSIRDFFMSFIMSYIKYKNKFRIKNISEEEKNDKVLNHIQYKENNFKTHYFLIRKFQNKTLVDDSCCVDISNFEYVVYLKIEYNEIFTQKHYFRNFNNEKDAIEYFNELLSNNKNKKVKNIINNLTHDINKKYKELQSRINSLENKLQANLN